MRERSGRALGQAENKHQVLQTQPESALAHTEERGATGGVRSTSLPSQHAFPVPFCKGILAMRDRKKSCHPTRVVQHRNRGWRGGGISSRRCSKLEGAVQPDLTGTDPGQSRDAYRCLPARLSLCFQHSHQDTSQSQELPNQPQ